MANKLFPCSPFAIRYSPIPPIPQHGSQGHEHHERRLLDQDSQQRESRRGPPGAEGAGGLASRLHRLVERHGTGRLPAVAGLSAHRLFGRSARLGQVRLCQDAGLSLGHPAGAAGGQSRDSVRRELRQAGLAGGAGRASRHAAPPDRDPGRHRTSIGRAAAPSRQDRALAVRPAQPVPGQCRGGPSSLGHGLSAAEIFRPRRPRGGRRVAAAPLGRCGFTAHARRLQRGDAGLAVVFHVHLFHRPRRQDAVALAGAIRLRSAVAHLPLHADRRGAPHVRRRDRHQPRGAADLRGDEGRRHRGSRRCRQGPRARRHRPSDHPEEAEPALFAVARPVRLRSVDQCGERLQCRDQGPLSRNPDRRRSPVAGTRPIRC